jgi:large subunit ribosomal protein L10
MARALKKMLIAGYGTDLGDGTMMIVVDPGNLTVERTRELRRDLREKAGGAKMRVVHNRTARRAFAGLYAGQEAMLKDILTGPSAIVVGGSGPGAVARVLRDWKRKHKPMRLKGGVAEGEVLDARGVEALADLPSLPEVRSMLLSAILGSARGLAVALSGLGGGIARATKARIEKGGFAAEAPAGGEPNESGGGTAG